MTRIITTDDIRTIFRCSETTAWQHLKKAREILGKKTNNNGKKGGDPVTVDQFYKAFNLNDK